MCLLNICFLFCDGVCSTPPNILLMCLFNSFCLGNIDKIIDISSTNEEGLCTLNGNCQAGNIYKATIICNEQVYGENIYICTAETTFKKRYSNHKKSFNLAVYKNDTEHSKEFWKIKRRNFVPKIN